MKSDRLLKSDEIKVRIVEHLSDGTWHSYYEIQKALGINHVSLKQHLRFLEMIDLAELSIVEPDESHSGKGSYKARITDKGLEWLKCVAKLR